MDIPNTDDPMLFLQICIMVMLSYKSGMENPALSDEEGLGLEVVFKYTKVFCVS